MTAEETKIKSPEEFIKEERNRRGIYIDRFPDFIIAQLLRDFHSQFQPQEVSDEEIEKTAENIAGLIVKRIKDKYDGLLRDAFDAARDGLYDITDVHFKYINFDEWMRSKLTGK